MNERDELEDLAESESLEHDDEVDGERELLLEGTGAGSAVGGAAAGVSTTGLF